jgi:hypothetical protein
MLEHADEKQDKDMIKSVLQKIIDDMNQYESDRILPEDRKPKALVAKVETEKMIPMEEDELEDGLNPEVLSQLMSKADEANENGETEEDNMEGLDPEIARLIAEKKNLGK